ncbi:N-acetylmuramoyl-L-alanine amidase [Tianweitania sp. Rool2]|uniref:N-acetylmuramoyl-L-alanine amidase n=2 Tax=Oryzicola mucosus TaxID=2767425 RepID=A0A8J6PNZ8_9HYPH|nr:N-acetylmuramoyl-L-alanine amidase [Oryzicola mucosus]
MTGVSRFLSWVFVLLAFMFGAATTAHAQDARLIDYKMAGDATRMRIVMNFDREPEPKWFLLRSPHRLVIDLPGSQLVIDPQQLKPRGLVAGVQYGKLDDSVSRLVLAGKGPFLVDKIDVLQNEGAPGYRIVADIAAASNAEFESALAIQAATTGSTVSTPKTARVGTDAPVAAKPFTIVIDPGHGGIDGGAEGPSGTVEKDITLAFSRQLKERLESVGAYKVELTRDGDEFLRLDDRVRIARQAGADLMISVHADTIRLKGIRGATVYTMSDKASDAEAQALADRENLSDALAGVDIAEENHAVSDILIDLIRRETHTFSIKFARLLVGELSNSIGMINNPHRSAGFRVLKAPDVPSVLVELGYLSNTEDEERLRNPEWRSKASDSIANAVQGFVAGLQRAGG